MDRPIPWELYRTLLAVLREGSLSAAARSLGLTQPTVGRQMDALESALGVALFIRSQHGLSPTDMAHSLRPHAEAMAASADALRREVGGGSAEGVVRIAASEVVGAEVLPPILAALRLAHPGLVIELALSNRSADLLRREADIAVRMVRPTQEALVARRIGEVTVGLFGRADYLQRCGVPHVVEDLLAHSVIGFDEEDAFIRSLRPRGLTMTRAQASLRTDSNIAQTALLRAGAGIGACQIGIAARDASLVRVLKEAFAIQLDVWLVMHEDLRGSRPVRIAWDALAEGLAAYVD